LSEPRVRIEEKERKPGQGLRMLLGQVAHFPKPVRVWNPETGEMEAKTKMETLFDASIPEVQYANYEGFSVGRDSKQRILILLASLGYSYPTTAIAEASNVATSTAKRVLWEMRRDGLLEGAFSHGTYIDSELWPYKYGPLRENYYMLTEEGAKAAEKLMTLRVIPLSSPTGETPWGRAARIASETREKMERER